MQLQSPLLQQALDKLESSIDDRASYEKFLDAGRTALTDPHIFKQLTAGLPQSKDPVGDTAKGVVFLVNSLAHRARGTAPPPAMVQAGWALVLKALDFEEQAGLVKVDKGELEQAITDYTNAVMPSVKLGGDRLGGILSQLKAVAGDPQRMAAFQQAVEKA